MSYSEQHRDRPSAGSVKARRSTNHDLAPGRRRRRATTKSVGTLLVNRRRWLTLGVAAIVFLLWRPQTGLGCCGDCNGDGTVSVSELITAITGSLNGCSDTVQPTCPLLATGQATGYKASDNDLRPVLVPDDGTLMIGRKQGYVDNSDGTITDTNTGLMWETKTHDGTLEDASDTYTWTATTRTIWGFLDALNSANLGKGFAGYRDWRIPNRRELESLVDAAQSNPAIAAIFSSPCNEGCSQCSCTLAAQYWSSTTSATDSTKAWAIDFSTGSVNMRLKSAAFLAVRAVRGGR